MTVIDGTNMIMGRLGTQVAKRILKREVIHIVNAEHVVITGNRKNIFEKFRVRLVIAPKGNPHKGPKFSRMPDRIVRRAIRGMLPWKQPRGKLAFKNLRVHIGVPEEFAAAKLEKIEVCQNRHAKGFTTVGELAKSLGAKW
ncbi:MAG TPA: 50S ribosomal protein L13 [Candidatus Diapherotrites archaeon]|uniref:Large ribosomal subunit protein uL13 n=1 Tax=Candidatus Iainarchaeum sp. TaxID=3101447 RepID=A0A7J4IZK3_9ARCH|nr:50S ribosomal protein L13 [Candidatus Diapherotrites archaeon]